MMFLFNGVIFGFYVHFQGVKNPNLLLSRSQNLIGVTFLDLRIFFFAKMSSFIPTETPLQWASLKVVLQFTVNVSLLDHPNAGSAFGDKDDTDV